MFTPLKKSGNREEDDKLALELVSSFISKEDGLIAVLSNLSALLKWYMDDVSWLGFYLINSKSDTLYLGPFQGMPACTRIKVGKGVCGTAYQKKETIIVPDVNAFPGHIACSSDTQSEIVVPLEGFGVLDVDSNTLNRFTNEDRIFLEKVMAKLNDFLIEIREEESR